MRRFWDKAGIERDGGGWSVLLDGKPMRLPGGVRLHLRGHALAEAVAEEWQTAGAGKGGALVTTDLPLTQLAATAEARIAPDPEPTVTALAGYAASDLLCYRAAGPPALVQRQAQAWQPWLDWVALTYDAPLRVTSGVMPVAQDPQALAVLRRAVAAETPETLAGLGVIVPALGSLVLGLALAAGRLGAAEAHAAAFVDEIFQAELWGEDEEAAARRRRIAEEVAVAARFIALCRVA